MVPQQPPPVPPPPPPGVIHHASITRNRTCPFYPTYNTRVSSQHNLVGAGFVSQGKMSSILSHRNVSSKILNFLKYTTFKPILWMLLDSTTTPQPTQWARRMPSSWPKSVRRPFIIRSFKIVIHLFKTFNYPTHNKMTDTLGKLFSYPASATKIASFMHYFRFFHMIVEVTMRLFLPSRKVYPVKFMF